MIKRKVSQISNPLTTKEITLGRPLGLSHPGTTEGLRGVSSEVKKVEVELLLTRSRQL